MEPYYATTDAINRLILLTSTCHPFTPCTVVLNPRKYTHVALSDVDLRRPNSDDIVNVFELMEWFSRPKEE